MTTLPLVVATVCARGGSKGVPRKNLRTIGGVPLLAHSVLQAKAAEVFERIIGSTDDAVMAEVLTAYGAEVDGLRPPELATDSANKWDVFRHLVEQFEAATGRRIDVLADLDTGAILRSTQDVRKCVQQLLSSTADVCVTAYEADHNPYYNMVERQQDGSLQVCLRHSPRVVNRQQAPPVFNLSPAVFAIRRDALWRYSHWSEASMDVSVIPRERALDIDTELDLKLVEQLWESRG